MTPVHWPPRCPDLNSLDYFFMSQSIVLKFMDYKTQVNNEEHWRRSQNETNNLRRHNQVMQGAKFNFLCCINLFIHINRDHLKIKALRPSSALNC